MFNISLRNKALLINLSAFKDLLAEAYTMRKLPPLPLDDTPGEVRMMLARMAILSNELLVSIELQLSKVEIYKCILG